MLFIGGMADGKQIDLHGDPPVYYFHRVESLKSLPLQEEHISNYYPVTERHCYIKQKLRGDNKTFFIMLFEDLTIDDLIRKLIQNYKEDRDLI